MKKFNSLLIIVLIFSLPILSAGCNELGFHISFKNIHGLKENDAVIYENSQIGRVKKITYQKDATFLVEIVLSDEYNHTATQYTQFYVGDSQLSNGAKAILVELPRQGGKPIEKGATIKGKSKKYFAFPKGINEPFWENLEEKFQGFIEEFQDIPESEQYKNMKKKLSEFEAQMEESGREIADKFQKEILPKLEQEIKKFMDKLEQQGRQEDAQSLEKDLNKLQSI